MALKQNCPLFLLVLIATLRGVTSQTFQIGGCRDIQGVDYTDYDSLQGIWYEFAKSHWHPEDNSRCVTVNMKTPIKGQKPIEFHAIDKFLFWDTQKSHEGNSSITGAGKGVTPSNYAYTYLYHDYNELLVLYTCQDYLLARNDVVWIFTRKRDPSCPIILKAYDVIMEYGLSLDNLKKTDQTDCPDTWEEPSNIFEYMFSGRG